MYCCLNPSVIMADRFVSITSSSCFYCYFLVPSLMRTFLHSPSNSKKYSCVCCIRIYLGGKKITTITTTLDENEEASTFTFLSDDGSIVTELTRLELSAAIELDLSNNNLKEVPAALFQVLDNTERVYVTNR